MWYFARMPVPDFVPQAFGEVGRLGSGVCVAVVRCSLDQTLRTDTHFKSLFIFVTSSVYWLATSTALKPHLGKLSFALHPFSSVWLFKNGLVMVVEVSSLGAAV